MVKVQELQEENKKLSTQCQFLQKHINEEAEKPMVKYINITKNMYEKNKQANDKFMHFMTIEYQQLKQERLNQED